jgi:hypothetical protein
MERTWIVNGGGLKGGGRRRGSLIKFPIKL